MPQVYEDGGPAGPVEPQEPKPRVERPVPRRRGLAHPGLNTIDHSVANALEVSASRTTEMWKQIGPATSKHLPYTMTYTTAANQDEALTYATNDVLQFFANIYGDENLGAFLGTYLISDPVSRRRTQDALAALHPDFVPVGKAAMFATGSDPEENLQRVLADPGAFDTLSSQDKTAVASLADELLSNLQKLDQNSDLGQNFETAVAVATNGYSVVLTPQGAEQLRRIVQTGLSGLPGTTQDFDPSPTSTRYGGQNLYGGPDTSGDLSGAATSLGIDQVRRQGQGTIVLDMDWARANPDQAYAIKSYLEAEFPGATIQYGREGIVGSLLDKFGMITDYVTSPFGAAAVQLKELSQRIGRSPEDQAKLLAEADRAAAAIRDGKVPKDKIEEVQRFITLARDEATDDFGRDQFISDTIAGAGPKQVGFGFADNMTKAMQILPGDPEYGFAYAAFGILAQTIVDPLNIGLPVLGGYRAAKLIPKVSGVAADLDETIAAIRAADATISLETATSRAASIVRESQAASVVQMVSRSWIEQMTYARMARYPEELATSKPFLRQLRVFHEARVSAGTDEAFAHILVEKLGMNPDAAMDMAYAARNESDLAIQMVNDMMGLSQKLPATERMASRLTEIDRELDRLDSLGQVWGPQRLAVMTPEREALIAERARLTSIIDGRDYAAPFHGLVGGRQLRRITKAAAIRETTAERLLDVAAQHVRTFPSGLLHDWNPRAMGEAVVKAPEIQTTTRRMFMEFRHLTQPTGLGETIVFPYTSPFAAALGKGAQETFITASDQSLQRLIETAKFMGHSEAKINRLMRPWVSGALLDDPVAGYEWIKDTWRTLIDDSPKLSAGAKRSLRDLYDVPVEERAGGRITRFTDNGNPYTEPTFPKVVTDQVTGDTYIGSLPSKSVDLHQSVETPSLASVRELATMQGNWRARWQAAGRPRKAVSSLHGKIAAGWQATNSFWRSTTLLSRIFGALPARIFGEQQFRIAVMDFASLVWHPGEWFRSTALGTRLFSDTDLALFANSPIHSLGSIVADASSNPNLRLAMANRILVKPGDGTAFYRSYAGELGRLFASPETHTVRMLNGEISDAQTILRALHADPETEKLWLKLWSQGGDNLGPLTPERAAESWETELRQVIGTGPGAETVKIALTRGKVAIDGRDVTIGTEEFAGALEKMAADGSWRPGLLQVSRKVGDYLPTSRFASGMNLKNFLFRYLYSSPDLAASRSPLFRQIAAREWRNLVRFGYDPGKALEIARGTAAERTADIMFTIGTHTSGEYLWRSISPFFPAWRELGTTWLMRAPSRIGRLGGTALAPFGWALGAAELGARIRRYTDLLTNLGVVHTDERGTPFVNIPGIAPIVRLLTGADTEFRIAAPLESFVGLFPLPLEFTGRDEKGQPLPWFERLRGVLPTLGGPSTLVLGGLVKAWPQLFSNVEDWTTLYGTDTSFGPIAVDRLLEAHGITPPWAIGTTGDLMDAQRTWAVIDGMRIAWGENPPPQMPTDLSEAGVKAFAETYQRWATSILAKGERYAQGVYILKAIAGMTLPFSIRIEDEDRLRMNTMWEFLNRLPDEAGGQTFSSSFISSVMATYPQLGPYMTGKTLDTRVVDDPAETLAGFMDAVRSGAVKIRSAEDWATFAMGMNSYALYQSRIAAIKDEAGATAGEVLMNFDNREQLQQEQARWRDFLTLSESDEVRTALGGTQSFADMFAQYQAYKRAREGDQGLGVELEQLLEFDSTMREYAKFFAINPESAEDYFKMRDAAYAALDGVQSHLMKGVSWWFDEVSSPYYDARNKLYKELDRTPDRDKALVYQKLRELADAYDRRWSDPRWEGSFPSPEEYAFAKLSRQDQRNEIASWADLPPTFLTRFQREQVGYDIPEGRQDEASAFAKFTGNLDHLTRRYLSRHDISPSSNEAESIWAQVDAATKDKARELGVLEFYRQTQVPEYHRIGDALHLGARTDNWNALVADADTLIKGLRAVGDSPSSTQTENARTAQRWFVDRANALRKQDPVLDDILNELAVSLGGDHPMASDDLLLKLFFDVFSTSDTFYLERRT